MSLGDAFGRFLTMMAGVGAVLISIGHGLEHYPPPGPPGMSPLIPIDPSTLTAIGMLMVAPIVAIAVGVVLLIFAIVVSDAFTYPPNTFDTREYTVEEWAPDQPESVYEPGEMECYICDEPVDDGVLFLQRSERIRFGIVTSAEQRVSTVECERCFTADPIDRQFLLAGLDLPDYDDLDLDIVDDESEDEDEPDDEDAEADPHVGPPVGGESVDGSGPIAAADDTVLIEFPAGTVEVLFKDGHPYAACHDSGMGRYHCSSVSVISESVASGLMECEIRDGVGNAKRFYVQDPEVALASTGPSWSVSDGPPKLMSESELASSFYADENENEGAGDE